MVTSCRVFTYSPNNQYANDYYNACRKFDDIRDKVIDYEHTSEDRTSAKYKQMMDEFTYWDAQVPLQSRIAGEEEDRLQKEKEAKKVFAKQDNTRSAGSYRIDGNLNYLA